VVVTEPSSTEPSAQQPPGTPPMPEVAGVAITHEYYDLPSVRMHVARAGDPSLPAVLLVHGWPEHWWMWRGVIAELSQEAHLIVPDLRGHGWSSVPSGRRAADKGALAEDLGNLLDAMGIDDIAIAGHDWGAFASQLLALDRPEKVRRLLVFSISSVIPTKLPPIRALWPLKYQIGLAWPFSDKVIARSGGTLIAKAKRADVRQRAQYSREDSAVYGLQQADPARAKFTQTMYRSFLLGDLARLSKRLKGRRFTMPVRFVFADHDGFVSVRFGDHLARQGDAVEVLTQNRTGHFVVDEDPAYVAGQIREWVLPGAVPLAG
jgi:pimeloyl-ACP methyl ester carboxylesterase